MTTNLPARGANKKRDHAIFHKRKQNKIATTFQNQLVLITKQVWIQHQK